MTRRFRSAVRGGFADRAFQPLTGSQRRPVSMRRTGSLRLLPSRSRLRPARTGERHPSGRAVYTSDEAERPWRTFPLLRLVAFLIGGVLIGTIGGRLLTPEYARQTDLAGLPPPPVRVERPCGPVSGKTAIIVVHGQSNAANLRKRPTCGPRSRRQFRSRKRQMLCCGRSPAGHRWHAAGALQRASATS